MLVLAARGVWTAAEQHHQAMALESGHVALPAVYTAFAGAHLAAAKGDAAAVLAAVAPLLALSAREAVDEPGFWPWQDVYAEALVDLGRLEEAERFLPAHEALAHERGRRSMIARLARARARLEAARGDDDAAQAAFLRSSELLGEVAMPYERALTELAHGQFLRRRRQRRAAVEVLANARDRFATVGARPALERCERELKASGLAPEAAGGQGRRTTHPAGADRHAPGHRRHDQPRDRGRADLSTKTVEVHLTRLYAKLEVPSRTELRARARRGELELARTYSLAQSASRGGSAPADAFARGQDHPAGRTKAVRRSRRPRGPTRAPPWPRRSQPAGGVRGVVGCGRSRSQKWAVVELLGRHVVTESTAGTEGGAARLGRRISKAAPPPGAFAALTEPPCASTIVPDAFVSAGTR